MHSPNTRNGLDGQTERGDVSPWEASLRDVLKRYPASTARAARRLRMGHRDTESARIFVLGVIGRHVEDENGAQLRLGNDDLRLSEDLGLDSLSMIEMMMVVEEALGINVPQERLRHIRTVGDIVGLIAVPERD